MKCILPSVIAFASALAIGCGPTWAQDKLSAPANIPLLQSPSVNTGSECGYPVANQPCADGKAAMGFLTGHLAIGNNVKGIDAYVGILGDETYTNTNQEMRGVSYTIRNKRTTADEATMGWDTFPLIGAVVVPSDNTQHIVGNMKSVVAESHFMKPDTGTYSVRNSFNIQSSLVTLGSGVTLENWQGMVVSATPTGGGTIRTGYGVQIGAVTATASAAVKLDGLDAKGRLLWNHWGMTEKSHGAFDFQYDGTDYFSLTAGTASLSGYQPYQTFIDTHATNRAARFQSAGGSAYVLLDTTGAGSFSAALTIASTGITSAGSVTTNSPANGTAAPWNLGSSKTSTKCTLDTTRHVEISINGTAIKLATCQ